MTIIKSISLENFKSVNKISVSFDENVTYLCGSNGDGKTTVGLDGIQFILQGVSEKGSKDSNPIIGKRFHFIANGEKSAKGYLILHDETLNCDIMVKRKITATTNELSFEAPEGIQLDQRWLNELFSFYMINPRAFVRLNPKDQAIALGIDTSEYDTLLKKTKEEYTAINAVIRSIGDIPQEMTPVEKVSVSELISQYQIIKNENSTIDDEIRQIEEAKTKAKAYEEAILKYQKALNELNQWIKDMGTSQEKKDTSQLEKQIEQAEQINNDAQLYLTWKEKKERLDEQKKKLSDNKSKQEQVITERLNYIKSQELPFKELNVDEDGCLTLSGRYINDNQFSTGELSKIVPMLMSKAKNSAKKIKYVYIQDYSLMDEKNQKDVVKYLSDKGFQVVCEVVGNIPIQDKNCIVLKESKVMNEKELL